MGINKKYSAEEKQARIDLRKNTQNNLISNSDEGIRLFKLLKKKKDDVAKINKQIKQAEKVENKSEVEVLKRRRQTINEEYDEQIEFTKENLSDAYLEQYKQLLNDYPIFMAIAEDIGYDATGKETKRNELPAISKELAKFINAIEEGKDNFFQ